MKALIIAALLLMTTLALVPAGEAKPLDPQCMPVYQRTDVGSLSIVRKDSCSAEFYWCETPGAPISECESLVQ